MHPYFLVQHKEKGKEEIKSKDAAEDKENSDASERTAARSNA